MGLLEFLHGRENDAVGLPAIKQILQMDPAFSMHRLLTQELLTFYKLAVKLVIKVVAVCQDYDRWAVQCVLQQMGIENHGQGLPAALGMPEYSALTISLGCLLCGCDGFFNGKILMISGQYLEAPISIAGKENKIRDLSIIILAGRLL